MLDFKFKIGRVRVRILTAYGREPPMESGGRTEESGRWSSNYLRLALYSFLDLQPERGPDLRPT